jgi:hypothetical protein
MAIIKRERWNEADVLALPSGEQDFFDRKSGKIISKPSFDDDLAKALSAFANSGGGHLVIGVTDAGFIDGLPETIKGRVRTKDWIEQKIPQLLTYPLQDFRVHEVEPSAPSKIPPGHVVIVIDVGDSSLAPHQVVKNHLYYYRAGGRSEPAPHFFLELLWGRQNKYPGQKVARAWLDIIKAALNLLYYQRESLDRDLRSWDRLERYDKRLYRFASHPVIYSPNLEQLLEFYPDMAEPIERHDKEVVAVWEAVRNLSDELVEQRLSLSQVYEEVMSPESRERLFEELKGKGVKSSSQEDLEGALFGSYGPDHKFHILAENIANHSRELHDAMVAPLWNLHREKFMAILTRQPYNKLEDKVSLARAQLRRTVDELGVLLKEKRRELATKFGEPYAATTDSAHFSF